MNIKNMQHVAEKVTGLMKILSNKTRLMILCQLVEGEKSVGDLAQLIGARSAALSQQLALLRKDGLVEPRRQGQTIYYSLTRSDVADLTNFLYNTYCAPMKTPAKAPPKVSAKTAGNQRKTRPSSRKT